MRRQVVATGYGGPEQLEVREHDPGAPGDGQVLVEVRAIGVNAWDVKSYSGTVSDDPDKLPILLGGECAGVVLGGDLPAGDEVIVHPVSGAYADYVVAKASSCVPKPAGMSWEEAAGLMLTGTAAAHLVSAAGVAEGETVLLNGAAGGVGLYAAQLARHRGARVLGTALPSDHEVLREMGSSRSTSARTSRPGCASRHPPAWTRCSTRSAYRPCSTSRSRWPRTATASPR